jgi:undecaprenyl-diphosphatase
MSWWQAVIFGLIQGITEFLPVSSSGHLVLAEKFMGLKDSDLLTFFSLLHVGTLVAVFVVMRKEILDILKNILGKLTWLLVVATIPAVIFTILFNNLIKDSFGGHTLGFEFIFTGILLLAVLFVRPGRKTMDKLSWIDALIAGIGQAIAILPAVSRSGTVLAALMFRKVKREDAIRFAFLMSIPAILGSLILDIFDIFKGDSTIVSGMALPIIIGVVFAAVSGYFCMTFMLKKLTRKGIAVCGIYVIVLGLFVLADQNIFHLLTWFS